MRKTAKPSLKMLPLMRNDSCIVPSMRFFINKKGANSKFMPLPGNREVPHGKHKTRSRARLGAFSPVSFPMFENSRFSEKTILYVNSYLLLSFLMNGIKIKPIHPAIQAP
jgi:hypothetical protein